MKESNNVSFIVVGRFHRTFLVLVKQSDNHVGLLIVFGISLGFYGMDSYGVYHPPVCIPRTVV